MKLKKLKRDYRDYSRVKTFGAVDVSSLPPEYLLVSTILTQPNNQESCTAYASSAIRESMTNKLYDPQPFFDAEKDLSGTDGSDGFDLRTAMAVGINTGFYPIGQAIPTDKSSAYFFCDGEGDFFDNIRMAMWQHKDKKISVLVGTEWYVNWTDFPIIPDTTAQILGGHALKCAGWTTIDSEVYLALQNSWGESMGEKGIYYVDRQTFNAQFQPYGAFFWVDDVNIQIQIIGKLEVLIERLRDLLLLVRNGISYGLKYGLRNQLKL